MYIRWLGSFRKKLSTGLYESILFETNRPSDIEVACEQLQKGESKIFAKVGLTVDPSAVSKRFDGDVWSEYMTIGNDTGKVYRQSCTGGNHRRPRVLKESTHVELRATRKGYEAHSEHKESFAFPVYTGIVVDGLFMDLTKFIRSEIIKASNETGLKVYELRKGKLVPVSF